MRFVCDVMLGRLAKYLRVLGFDAEYARDDAALERFEREEKGRILLTRRKKTWNFPRVVLVKSDSAREQLREIKELIRGEVARELALNRCIECNKELIEVDKTEIEILVPEFVYHQYDRFKQCPSCGRFYWEGSHTRCLDQLMEEVLT
jgi:uncharacterized protein with PIN domain